MDAMTSKRRSGQMTARAGRRRLLGLVFALMSLMSLFSLTTTVLAQDAIISTEVGAMPSSGGARPGPATALPPSTVRPGVLPKSLQIPKAQVDAEVEQIQIVNGAMQDPTGPWVVSWYKETAKIGQKGNAVMAGHVDYWDVGPAVFYHLEDVAKDDEIDVTGENGVLYKYKVEWNKLYDANADAKAIQEIVGPTNNESLTLITCGGPFDYNSGHYLQRRVVRATRVK